MSLTRRSVYSILALVALCAGLGAILQAAGHRDASGPASSGSGGASFGAVSGGGAGSGSSGNAQISVPGSAPEQNRQALGESAIPGTAIGPKIVKDASLEVRIKHDGFRTAWRAARAAVAGLNGFATSTSIDGRDARSGTLVLSIPESNFERAVSRLEALGKVAHESTSGRDVSKQFVDIKARLRNAAAQERVLLNLMDQAASVSDTIRVQQQLQGVQLNIEELKGQLRYLSDQTAMGTITLRLFEAGTAGAPPPTTIEQAWGRAGATFLGVISAVIVGAGFVVPVGIFALAGVLVFRVLRPRLSA